MRTWEKYLEAVNISIGCITSGDIDLVDVLGMVDGDIDLYEEYEMHTSADAVARMVLTAAGYPL